MSPSLHDVGTWTLASVAVCVGVAVAASFALNLSPELANRIRELAGAASLAGLVLALVTAR
jgi:uncharacterized YccA/Bax inhibitor family protein